MFSRNNKEQAQEPDKHGATPRKGANEKECHKISICWRCLSGMNPPGRSEEVLKVSEGPLWNFVEEPAGVELQKKRIETGSVKQEQKQLSVSCRQALALFSVPTAAQGQGSWGARPIREKVICTTPASFCDARDAFVSAFAGSVNPFRFRFVWQVCTERTS